MRTRCDGRSLAALSGRGGRSYRGPPAVTERERGLDGRPARTLGRLGSAMAMIKGKMDISVDRWYYKRAAQARWLIIMSIMEEPTNRKWEKMRK